MHGLVWHTMLCGCFVVVSTGLSLDLCVVVWLLYLLFIHLVVCTTFGL